MTKAAKPASEPAKSVGKQNGGQPVAEQPAGERNGPRGPEPTRFGDWEKGGRCYDF